jgi:hypothetical protein
VKREALSLIKALENRIVTIRLIANVVKPERRKNVNRGLNGRSQSAMGLLGAE